MINNINFKCHILVKVGAKLGISPYYNPGKLLHLAVKYIVNITFIIDRSLVWILEQQFTHMY